MVQNPSYTNTAKLHLCSLCGPQLLLYDESILYAIYSLKMGFFPFWIPAAEERPHRTSKGGGVAFLKSGGQSQKVIPNRIKTAQSTVVSNVPTTVIIKWLT